MANLPIVQEGGNVLSHSQIAVLLRCLHQMGRHAGCSGALRQWPFCKVHCSKKQLNEAVEASDRHNDTWPPIDEESVYLELPNPKRPCWPSFVPATHLKQARNPRGRLRETTSVCNCTKWPLWQY